MFSFYPQLYHIAASDVMSKLHNALYILHYDEFVLHLASD